VIELAQLGGHVLVDPARALLNSLVTPNPEPAGGTGTPPAHALRNAF
jgi:hypothetical protein